LSAEPITLSELVEGPVPLPELSAEPVLRFLRSSAGPITLPELVEGPRLRSLRSTAELITLPEPVEVNRTGMSGDSSV
jgi:hypothetical protein